MAVTIGELARAVGEWNTKVKDGLIAVDTVAQQSYGTITTATAGVTKLADTSYEDAIAFAEVRKCNTVCVSVCTSVAHANHASHGSHDSHANHAEHDSHASHHDHAQHDFHFSHADHNEHDSHADHLFHGMHYSHYSHSMHSEHSEHYSHVDHNASI